ncbi:uncharacterized protein [Clytia hemisphaerica]
MRFSWKKKHFVLLMFLSIAFFEIVLLLKRKSGVQFLPFYQKDWSRIIDRNDNGTQTCYTKEIHLFLKHISRAQRFERHSNIRRLANVVTTRLSRLNVGHFAIRNSVDNVTVILNAVNEIENLTTILMDLKHNPSWKAMIILLGLKQKDYELYSSTLKDIRKVLPSFRFVVFKPDKMETTAKTLLKLIRKVKTKFIFLARKLRKIDQNFSFKDFLSPLLYRTVDVLSGSIAYLDGLWSTGCHQTKLIWSQYKAEFGGDVGFGRGLIQCDNVDGPLALERDFLVNFLQKSVQTNCLDKLLYPELIFKLNNERKIMKVHFQSIFHMENSSDFRDLVRMEWLIFSFRNQISEIIATHENYEKTHFEFTYVEAKSDCGGTKSNMLKPRACMRSLHHMLMDTYKLFDKLGYGYTNEDGSGMAATKLDDTLPWDLDQDFAFRASNFTDLLKHENEFGLKGMHFKTDIDKPCLKNASASNGLIGDSPKWTCGYIGVRGNTWRLEAWGEYVLIGDFYQPWNLHPFYKNVFPPNRIIGEDTKVHMRDHWSPNRPNPGLYARSHYGYDVLKHAKHWMDGGSNRGYNSWGDYVTKPRFEDCPVEGHHLCLNQYLADGNIQFQHPWA